MKQRNLKDVLPIWIFGLILLFLALFIAGVKQNALRKTSGINADEVLSGAVSGQVLIHAISQAEMFVNVHNISEPFERVDPNIVFYFIVTESNQVLLLEASAGDKTLRKMSENYLSLADNPERVTVQGFFEEKVVSDILNQMKLKPDFKEKVRKDVYLSSYQVDEDRRKATFISLLLGGIGLFLLGIGVFRFLSNQKTYQGLYKEYPELAENFNRLREAEFFDEELGLALYKNHFISFRQNIKAIDLRTIQGLRYFVHFCRNNGKTKKSRYSLDFYARDGKQHTLYFSLVKADVNLQIAPLFAITHQRFPGIAFIQ